MNDKTDEAEFKSTMYRYMTQELAEDLLKLDDAKLGEECKDVSIVFSDIHNYTAWAEGLEVEEVVTLVNEYFETMVEPIFKYQGTLDNYIDIGIRAVFGSPLPLENHAWCAVQTAVEMHYRLAEFNVRCLAQNHLPFQLGIGINSNRVFTGNIGSSKRKEFAAVGNGVNLASRLQRASKQYGCNIVISDTTYRLCADRIWAKELDRIRLKDINQPVTIYELVGLRSEPISEQKLQAIEHYEKGRQHYLNHQFECAFKEFGIVREIDKGDQAAKLHLERCQHYINNPPSSDWDGGWSVVSC